MNLKAKIETNMWEEVPLKTRNTLKNLAKTLIIWGGIGLLLYKFQWVQFTVIGIFVLMGMLLYRSLDKAET